MRSFDGKEIFTRLWDEVDEPKGIVQLCHGMAEHTGRYDDFAKFLNRNGYIVFGDDHRGHGKTDNGSGHCDGEFVDDTVKDLLFFNEYLKKTYPDLPRIFFGHSYGSCLAQRFIEHDTGITACVMTGTSTVPHFVCRLGQALLSPLKAVAPKARFGLGELGKFKNEDVPSAWLTKDKAIREQYNADPLSGGKCSATYFYGFVKLMSDSSKKENREKINGNMPIGIFCGKDDVCGQYGKGPEKLANEYRALGKKVHLKLYENDRHEILNETDRDIVYSDILEFINSCIF